MLYMDAMNIAHITPMYTVLQQNYKSQPQQHQQTSGSSFKKFILSVFSIAEIKLLIVFFCYWITIILLTSTHSFYLRKYRRLLDDAFPFIACTAGGYRPECERFQKDLMQDEINVLLALSWITLSLFAFTSWVNLFFVIQISDLKAIMNKISRSCCN